MPLSAAVAVGKIVIDCGRDTCTTSSWQDPVTLTALPFWQSGWMLVVVPVVLIAVIVAIGVVRYRRHERLEDQFSEEQRTKREEANIQHTNCPGCGLIYVPGN